MSDPIDFPQPSMIAVNGIELEVFEAGQENAGNPHYHPSQEVHRAIRPGEVLLLDLWGKLRHPGAVFADITWVGFTGRTVPEEYVRAFAAARDGRDAAIELVQSAARTGRELRGCSARRLRLAQPRTVTRC